MSWSVEFTDEFDAEFDALPESVQDELLAQAKVIEMFGPSAMRRLIKVADERDDAHLARLKPHRAR
jgi:hypothetical protein